MVAKYIGPPIRGEVNPRVVTIKDSDLLTIARGLVGEGSFKISKATASAMMWALMNRIMLTNARYPGTTRPYEYREMWELFSQPINTRWDGIEGNEPAGLSDFCGPGGRWENSKFCSADRLTRRSNIAKMSWEDIPSGVIMWVRQFQAGTLFPPDEFATKTNRSRISNWSAATLKTSKNVPIPEEYPWGFKLGGEWFFEDSYLRKGEVTVESDPEGFSPTAPTGFTQIGVAGVLAAGGVAGTVSYLLAKYVF